MDLAHGRGASRRESERADAARKAHEAAVRQAAWHAEQQRAQIRGGVPADQIPDGVSPAAAMLQAAKNALPRRRSVLETALANDETLEYVPVRDGES